MRQPRALALLAGVTALIAVAGAGVSGAGAASPSPTASPRPLSWEKWQHLPGVFDLGVQADNAGLLAQGSVFFFKVDRAGAVTPINTQGSYTKGAGVIAYFAVSQGEPIGGACRFQTGAIYVIDPNTTRAIVEVDPTTGRQRPFASISGVDSINGITFDGSGSFGDHPLLVTGPLGGKSEVAAIDCHGDVKVITSGAPRLEGGIAVAPVGFGSHGGELVAADEIGGDIIGIKPDGTSSILASYRDHVGRDVGVESAGFVPKGFITHGGYAYLSDRGTTNNPHPGTDSILRLSSAQLATAGAREGDLVVATEGGGTTIDVSCAQDCAVRPLAAGPPAGHIEGHLIFLPNLPAPGATATSPAPKRPVPTATPPPTAAPGNGIFAAALAGVGLAVIAVALVLLVRRRLAG